MLREEKIHIGTIYNLKEEYAKNYTHGFVSIDLKTGETIIELWSNWNSSYNTIERYKPCEPLDVVKMYQA